MTAWSGVIANVQASGFGLVIGVPIGYLAARVRDRMAEDRVEMARGIAGALFLVLAVWTLIQLAVTSGENRRAAECQAQDRIEFRNGLQARAEAANRAADAEIAHADRDLEYLRAQDSYIEEVTRPGTTAERRRELALQYREAIAAKAEADQAKKAAQQDGKTVRRDNPVTEPDECSAPRP